MPPYRLRLFGGAALTNGGAALDGVAVRRQTLALLAILAASHPDGISRDKVAALLWPEGSAEQASSRLKQLLYLVRRELGTESVLGTAELRLGSDVIAADVVEFNERILRGERREAALTYRGPFLDGFHLGGDTPDFERWSESQRMRLAARWRGVVEALAREASQRGSHADARQWWQRLTEADPLDGSAAEGLVLATASVGDRAGALRLATDYTERLDRDLGVSPDARFVELVTAIRAGTRFDEPRQLAPLEPRHIEGVGTTAATATAYAEYRHSPEERSPRSSPSPRLTPAWIATPLLIVGAFGALLLRDGRAVAASRITTPLVVVAQLNGSDGAMDANRQLLAGAIGRHVMNSGMGKALALALENGGSAVASARRARASHLFTIRVVEDESGARAIIDLIDVKTGYRHWVSPPVSLSRSDADSTVEVLAERSVTALVVRTDSFFLNWIDQSSEPTSLRSYRDFRQGMEAWSHLDVSRAEELFAAVMARDPDFTMATYAWALIRTRDGGAGRNVSDPVVARLRALRSRDLPPHDRALIESELAAFDGNLPLAYLKSDDAVAIAPRSEWVLQQHAKYALLTGRGREAVRTIDRLREYPGHLKDGPVLNWSLAQALHFARLHDRERLVAQELTRKFPDNDAMRGFEAKALASQGRAAEIDRLLDEIAAARTTRAAAPVELIAVAELWAHGDLAGARRIAARALARSTKLPNEVAGTAQRSAPYWHFVLGDVKRARELLESKRRMGGFSHHDLRLLGIVTAAMGDSIGARAIERELDQPDQDAAHILFSQAQVLAWLGARDEAVDRLRQAYRLGFRGRYVVHYEAGFNPLLGYPPFETLARSID